MNGVNINQLVPPAAPPAPVADAAEQPAEGPEAAEREALEKDAFQKAVRKELDKRDAAWDPAPSPTASPWAWLNVVPVAAVAPGESSDAVSAASALGEKAAPFRSFFTAPLPPRRETSRTDAAPEPEAVEARPAREDDAVHVLVEPGLAPIQPAHVSIEHPVPLVEFPQLVTGQVQKLMRDNTPVTQLDFHISPPHIGPVNLQLSLQNGAVNVQLVALSTQAKQVLEQQTHTIASILQAHNLAPGQIKVVMATNGRGNASGASLRGGDAGAGTGASASATGAPRRQRGAIGDDMAVKA